MKVSIGKSNLRLIFSIGFIYGAILFILIYGVKILNVRYDDWLLSGGDLSQHYIGWLFYRNTPWQFPFGMIEGLASPDKVSIIFMDSIPIMALFSKILSPILPKTYQYFGIWGLLSYALMGGFSSILLKKYIDKNWVAIVGSTFFIISPYVLQRMYSHTSLAGQWIIIVALVLWLYNPYKENFIKKVLLWCILASVASSVHIYFIPMIFIILGISCIRDFLETKKIKESLCLILCAIVVVLITLICYGGFYQSGSASTEGLGYYSANINTLFNPIGEFSRLLRQLPCGAGQYEGMGYLGFGVIILLLIAIYRFTICGDTIEKYKFEEKNIKVGLLGGGIFLILALSPTIMFGEGVIINIPWPKVIINLLSIFRASGRFIWPLCYILIFIVIVVGFNSENAGRVRSTIFILLIVSIQVFDLSGVIKSIHNKHNIELKYESGINEYAWNSLLQQKEHIVFEPYDLVFEDSDRTFAIGIMADKYGVDMNSFYISRINAELIQANIDDYIEELENGISRNDTVYVFKSNTNIWQKDYPLTYYEFDNLVVGVSDDIETLNSIQGVEKLDFINHEQSVKMQDLHLTQDDNNSQKVKVISPGITMYGPYYPMDQGTYKVEINGSNLLDPSLTIVSYSYNEEGFEYQIQSNTENKVVALFSIPENIDDLEIKILNDKAENIIVDSVKLQKVD